MRFTCPNCSHTAEAPANPPAACPACGFAPAAAPVDCTVSYDPSRTLAYAGGPHPRAAPDVVGGYRLLRLIGTGGMGTVYEAEQIATGRRVALKLIRPEFAASRQAVARFRREGRLASTVTHPRCVFVLTADEDDGRPYIVMELVPGATLKDLVDRTGPLAPAEAIAKTLDLIDGLEALHRRGIVHRDVKPGNCFLDADGRVKVGDFGLAFSLVAERDAAERGRFAGTPLFASPEQHRGEPLDARTDVYSASATLYFLLTGRPPFDGRDTAELLKRIESGPADSMRTLRPELPAALDRVVLRGLERAPGRRWQSLDALKQALLRFGPARQTYARLRVRVAAYLIDEVAITAVVLALGLPLFLLLRLWLPGLDLNTAPTPRFNICSGMGTYDSGNALLAAAVDYLYFGVLEGVFGCGLGKWLLGLRVVPTGDDRPPGVPRALARAAVFCLLIYLPRYLLGVIEVPCFAAMLCGLMSWWNLGSLAVIASTMRRQNGWRGLHDFASGTCVVQVALPGRERRRDWLHRPCPDRLAEPLFVPDGLPQTVGPFAVRGVLARHAGVGVVLAEDAALGRNVVLWLRPAEEPPLPPARREASRLTRLRWLAEGVEGTARWDAFVAEEGRPLTDLVAEGGTFTWEQTRQILHALAEELAAACAEDTVPKPAFPVQVWVRPDGGVFLFDLPPEGTADLAEPAPPSGDARALALLGEVAALGLEGRERPAGRPPVFVRAPLPLSAAEMLARLLGGEPPYDLVADFQADLAALNDRPARVSRGRRAVQILLQGAMVVTVLLLVLAASELADRACRALAPVSSPESRRTFYDHIAQVLFCLIPVGGMIWSTLARGGPTFFACGLALVRADGRPAAGWQALLRCFLAWAEGIGFLVLLPYGATYVILWLTTPDFFHNDERQTIALYVWLGWVVVFTILAVWLPRRPLIDRLARTYIVPR